MLVFLVFTALYIIIYQYYGYDLIRIYNSNKSESIKIIYYRYYERALTQRNDTHDIPVELGDIKYVAVKQILHL